MSGTKGRSGRPKGSTRWTPDDFWEKVSIRGPTQCWPWLGSREGGYGRSWDGRAKRVRPAHVIAWELHNGKSIGNKLGLHTCDNRRCCNPRHVFRGTAQNNVDDMIQKGRARFGLGGRPRNPNRVTFKYI